MNTKYFNFDTYLNMIENMHDGETFREYARTQYLIAAEMKDPLTKQTESFMGDYALLHLADEFLSDIIATLAKDDCHISENKIIREKLKTEIFKFFWSHNDKKELDTEDFYKFFRFRGDLYTMNACANTHKHYSYIDLGFSLKLIAYAMQSEYMPTNY